MALFHYRYLDAEGKKKKGLIDAANVQEAKERLRVLGVLITHLENPGQKKIFFWGRKGDSLQGEALITFTTQLSQLLKAGIPLFESLLSLEEQYRNEKFHPIILSLSDQVKGGSSLSKAMSQFPKSFTTLYCAMVKAGESVGVLDKTLEKLASLLNKQSKLKKQLVTALIYPSLLFSFSLVVIFLLLTFVIPSLEALFEDREVNFFTRSVILCSHFLTHWWALHVPLALLFLGGGVFLYFSPKAKRWGQRKMLSLPLLNTLIIQAAVARFARTTSTLLQGGVTIIQALKIGRKVMKNPFLEEVIEKAETQIIQGSQLSEELKNAPYIPPLVSRMLSIGEEGGSTPMMLHKIAEIYEEEVEKSLSRLTALAQPVILLIMGAVVGLIMLAVLLPLTDVSAFI